MKKLILTFLTCCLSLTSLPVQAQNDLEALGAAIDTIQWSRRFTNLSFAADGFLEELADKHKKNAKLLYLIAQSYFYYTEQVIENNGKKERQYNYAKDDTTHAFKYIRMAIEADPTYTRPYILAGDIMRVNGKMDEVMSWFERGLAANPTDSTIIRAQFKMQARIGDIQNAIAKLEEMRAKSPDFPVEIEVARLYRDRYLDEGGEEIATAGIEWYDKVKEEAITAGDLVWYVSALPNVAYARAKNESRKVQQAAFKAAQTKALNMAENGCQRYPKNFALHQSAMRLMVDLDRYDDALKMYEIMQTCDKYKDEPRDHYYLSQAYTGLKRLDDAMKELAISETMPGATENDANRASRQRYTITNLRAQELAKAGKYDEAIAMYKALMDERLKEKGKLDASNYRDYAQYYLMKAQAYSGDEKIAILRQTDNIYVDWIANEPEPQNIVVALMRRMEIEQHIHGEKDKSNEDNFEGIATGALRVMDYCESLPESEMSTGVTNNYEKAMRMAYEVVKTIYLKKQTPQNKARLKQVGERVMDKTNNTELLALITKEFGLLKIK